MKKKLLPFAAFLVGLQISAQQNNANKVLEDDPAFKGIIGRTYKESKEDWPELPAAPAGAPNVIVILLDDVGFGMASTFGGPVPTPSLDKLASQGVKYNRFHTTAICSATRAALITGRNHHVAGSGFLVEWATGFPSYDMMIPKRTATVAAALKYNGINTAWFGKNHNTPDWETSAVGPFDRWPNGMGFDYFYGFNNGETDQYNPIIFENTTPVEQAKTPEEGYHFMVDMTDKAIEWMQMQKSIAPDKPVFMYYAPGAIHAPHQVFKEWKDKFKGKFDMGWDKQREITFQRQKQMGIIPADAQLSPRNPDIKEWDKLSAEEKKLYLAMMENYAGYMAFADEETGRLIEAVHKLPDADNTLIFYIVGDNGASAEGGLEGTLNEIKALNGIQSSLVENLKEVDKLGEYGTAPHIPVGWAMAMNTPFPWCKQVASHFGGTRNPMVVSWPKVIKPDGVVRDQFLHTIDIVPTIMEATGIKFPEYVEGVKQDPIDGVSFMSTFTDGKAPEVRKQQYFEIFANRAMYKDGWVAAHQHTKPWRQDIAPGFENEVWQLYNIDQDFSEAVDVSKKYPEKLAELQKAWEEDAQKYKVYPLDDRGAARLAVPKPSPLGDRKSFTFYEGAIRIPETAAPNTKNKSWNMEAIVNTVSGKKDGVINALGGMDAGYVLYVMDGYPTFVYNYFGKETEIKSSQKLPDGEASVKLDFDYAGGGVGKAARVKISINNKEVASGNIDATVPGRFGLDSFGIGVDTGSPVTGNYKVPFEFAGKISEVNINLLN